MAASRIQLDRDLCMPGPLQLLRHLSDPLTVVSDGILCAAGQEDGQLLRQLFVPFRPVDPRIDADQIMHSLDREEKTAERILDIPVHDLLIPGQPVIGRSSLKALVVASEGHAVQQLALELFAPEKADQGGHGLSRAGGRIRSPRSHEDRSGRGSLRMHGAPGPADKGAHGVPHHQKRKSRVFLSGRPDHRMEILHQALPAVLLSEPACLRRIVAGGSVTRHVVHIAADAPFCQKFQEGQVPLLMLRHAVMDRQHGPGRRLRQIGPGENIAHARGGGKVKMSGLHCAFILSFRRSVSSGGFFRKVFPPAGCFSG